MSIKTEEFFVDLFPSSKVTIDFYERTFQLEKASTYVEIGNERVPLGFSIDYYVDTGEEEYISPENPPILDRCLPTQQLTVNNSQLIRNLYEESLLGNFLQHVGENKVKIILCDRSKVEYWSQGDTKKNSWLIFRPGVVVPLRTAINSLWQRELSK